MRALSFSSINLYKECPQRFKFRYVDGIKEAPKSYFSFGQSVHKALEFLYRSQLMAPSLEEILHYFETNWVRGGYASEKEEKLQFAEGSRIVRAFYAKHIADWQPAFATEYSFNHHFDGVEVTGKIDRIDKLPTGELHVMDYKTGKSFAYWRPRQDEQLTLYQLATEAAFGLPVARLTLYHLPTLNPISVERHPDTLVRGLRKEIIQVKSSIDKKIFDPKPEERKCLRCDYRPICPAWGNNDRPKTMTMKTTAQAALSASPAMPAESNPPTTAPPMSPQAALENRVGQLEQKVQELQGEITRLRLLIADPAVKR
ncbi:MAG: PD-(D/E)XK nuclease family protein [Elusimicrobia bacterium]|nr:PD-(D/E)XK nuclease family protein [Elusimicrobiota bacterium]